MEIWYLDSFELLVGQNDSQPAAVTGHIHKYLRTAILSRFGPEVLKDKLIPMIEDMIRTRLDDWSKSPSLEMKASISSVIQLYHVFHLLPCECIYM